MNTFKTHILAASNTFYEGECESLIVPTADGQYGILAGHCDIIRAVVPGKMTYRVPGGENQIAAVSGGLVKVEDGEVLVLVDSAERPEEIDANRAREAAAAAKEAMLQERSIREFHAAQMTLARATVRLKVKSVNQQP